MIGWARRTVETDPEIEVKPRKAGETIVPGTPMVVTYIFTQDPLFHLCVVLPLIIGIGLLTVVPIAGIEFTPAYYGTGIGLLVWFVFAFTFLCPIIGQEQMGVRIENNIWITRN